MRCANAIANHTLKVTLRSVIFSTPKYGELHTFVCKMHIYSTLKYLAKCFLWHNMIVFKRQSLKNIKILICRFLTFLCIFFFFFFILSTDIGNHIKAVNVADLTRTEMIEILDPNPNQMRLLQLMSSELV